MSQTDGRVEKLQNDSHLAIFAGAAPIISRMHISLRLHCGLSLKTATVKCYIVIAVGEISY